MREIGKDADLVAALVGRNTLFDSRLRRVSIHEDAGSVRAEVLIKMRDTSQHDCVLLAFSDVQEFYFYHRRDYVFEEIDRLRFFIDDEGIYLSLDPAGEGDVRSEDDQDVITAASVTGYATEEPAPTTP